MKILNKELNGEKNDMETTKKNIVITFPDGKNSKFHKGITGYEIAESISKSLAREAAAIEVNGNLDDLTSKIENNTKINIIKRNDDEALDAFQTLAQSEGIIPALESSHALAQALKMAETATTETIYLVNLSGRGDKDLAHVHAVLHPNEQSSEATGVKHRGEA